MAITSSGSLAFAAFNAEFGLGYNLSSYYACDPYLPMPRSVTGEEVPAYPLQYAKTEQGSLRHRAADEAAAEHLLDVAVTVTIEVVEEAVM